MDAEPEPITDQDSTEMKVSEDAGARWGIPVAEPVSGKCADCGWFRYLDAHYELLDYGVCLAETSPFDGKVVNRSSGCPVFIASHSA